jgi:hypothetical protein
MRNERRVFGLGITKSQLWEYEGLSKKHLLSIRQGLRKLRHALATLNPGRRIHAEQFRLPDATKFLNKAKSAEDG